MLNRLVLTRIILIIGILLAARAPAWSQEPQAPNSLSPQGRTVTVTGYVLGQTLPPGAESLAIVLLPGWSETLSADIAAGTAPMVLLQSGRVERVVAAQSDTRGLAGRTGSFEFRNVSPGEYQAVAVRIKEGSDAGAAIAVGTRVIVEDRDIADLDLEITALPSEPPSRLRGGAANREAAVLGTVNQPAIGAMPPNTRPSGPASSPSYGAGYSKKKDVLEQILVLGVMAVMTVFTLW